MILTTQMLIERYHDYANPKARIRRLVDCGDLFPLTRGIRDKAVGKCPGSFGYGWLGEYVDKSQTVQLIIVCGVIFSEAGSVLYFFF